MRRKGSTTPYSCRWYAARSFYADGLGLTEVEKPADLRARAGAGHEVDWSQRATFAGYERFHAFDGHGNRVEVLTPA